MIVARGRVGGEEDVLMGKLQSEPVILVLSY